MQVSGTSFVENQNHDSAMTKNQTQILTTLRCKTTPCHSKSASTHTAGTASSHPTSAEAQRHSQDKSPATYTRHSYTQCKRCGPTAHHPSSSPSVRRSRRRTAPHKRRIDPAPQSRLLLYEVRQPRIHILSHPVLQRRTLTVKHMQPVPDTQGILTRRANDPARPELHHILLQGHAVDSPVQGHFPHPPQY